MHPLRIINWGQSITYEELHQDDVNRDGQPERHTEDSSCGAGFVLDRGVACYDNCMAVGGAQWIGLVKPAIIIDCELKLATIPGLLDMSANWQPCLKTP